MSYKLRYAKLRGVARFAAAVVASGVAVAGLLSPATAAAQPAVGSSEATRQGAWDTRNSLNSQAGTLPPDAAQAVQGAVDGAVNGMFPGLIQEREAAIRAENERRAAAEAQSSAPQSSDFDRGPCPATARACVDLAGQRTWLQKDGNVEYGPITMSSGAQGWETPRGTHKVTRKVKDEISREFHNAPMPYSVYFTNTGVAFHAGRVDWLSHGCIHLNHDDAVTYFNSLKPGDVVFVY
ncbi:L,D-transpeptidase [Corynebacterium durum]|uniref:ErfK/YbiS/YcfS/YnhG n=1 Tax=Corynebacterium durum F0235 TaxID=1035195 RepID=L1M8F6_9CORY|nr:L,D-transpeptidase [Corynebacterium durum]EKX87538.1 ErfK/YbiS/YcfS/YnhG [Corynebacterium durum F0235]MBF1731713.1 L,D-transpeptidase [Trueperella pyogenes]MDO4653571.1 L,D-transpeptidase [Corynebacterium durum]